MALLKRKRSGLSDPMAVVTNFVNACNRHDSEAVSSCLHPDFDSIQPMYPSRNFRGADQVRRNWQAIFDAEPGFRLTVLRSAANGETVWLELHGAGRDAEVAGVFVMGIQGDRIRWARIYSALVEDAPAATGAGGSQPPPPLRQVPPLQDDTGWGEVAADIPAEPAASENPAAPVFEIDGGGSRRRGRFRRKGREGWAPEAPVEEAPVEEAPVEEAPVEEAPVEEAPVEEAPVEEAPVEEAPVEEAPVEEAPVEEAPVEEAVEQQPLVEDAPAPAWSTPAPTADFAASPTAGPGQSTGSAASEPEITVETMVEVAPETAPVPEALVDAPDVDGDHSPGDGEQEPPRWRPV